MIHKPDDAVLDYFIFQCGIGKALGDVEKFENGYQHWLSRRGGA